MVIYMKGKLELLQKFHKIDNLYCFRIIKMADHAVPTVVKKE